MNIKTGLTESELKSVLADGVTFIINEGKIVAEESFKGYDTDGDGVEDEASETEKVVVDMSLEKVFKDLGKDPSKVQAMLVKCNYEASNGSVVAGRCWIDRDEYLKWREDRTKEPEIPAAEPGVGNVQVKKEEQPVKAAPLTPAPASKPAETPIPKV